MGGEPRPTGSSTGLTDDDMERIRQFAERVPYERTPDMLCPDEEE